jgi:hypothetical protein
VAPGQECVIVDLDGRYAQLGLSAPDGRIIDVANVREEELRALLRARFRVSVLDCSRCPDDSRSKAVGMALSVVAAHRAQTGRPHWLIIDDAETMLNDPDIPPHALDLSVGGHCLVIRSPDGLPGSLATSIGVVGMSVRLTSGGPAPDHEADLLDHVDEVGRQSSGHDDGSGGDVPGQCRFELLLCGEDCWTSNHLLFADEIGALNHARGIFSRWIIIEKIRIRGEGAPKDERYVSGSEHPDWYNSCGSRESCCGCWTRR